MSATSRTLPRTRVLVTGGCGFLGCNLADALVQRGEDVLVLDNLSRAGTEENAEWLKTRHGKRIAIEVADIRDLETVKHCVRGARAVLHLAAQVAVTTSLDRPVEDFDINTRGTLNVLESVRLANAHAPVIFASTNKVYGKLLGDDEVVLTGRRYAPVSQPLRSGVSERTPLDLYSPYGCSKGAADQYVRDYARVFGLRTIVLRMSCIYGPRQFGNEDQGWIAHFLLRAIRKLPVTVYGTGYQVRDALYVDDAVAAWLGALERVDAISGRIFNLGGGATNSISLRELVELIAQLRGAEPRLRFERWRPGDQPWYVSDISAISRALDWTPRTPLREGLRALERWLDGRFAERSRRLRGCRRPGHEVRPGQSPAVRVRHPSRLLAASAPAARTFAAASGRAVSRAATFTTAAPPPSRA
jgi:CDP-paratose 2-epimerase